jgi:hypothetical protein
VTPPLVLNRISGLGGFMAVQLGVREGDSQSREISRRHVEGMRSHRCAVPSPHQVTRELVDDRRSVRTPHQPAPTRQFIQVPSGTSVDMLGRRTEDGALWPWPTTFVQATSGPRKGSRISFPNAQSGLHLCGYRVGQQSMTDQNRQRFLRHFFTRPLPRAVSLLLGDAYGEPGSSQRL